MGYRSKVAVATDKEGMEKVLEVARDNGMEPDDVKSFEYTASDGSQCTDYVIVWDWVKWYVDDNYEWIDNIDKAIEELPYYDYIILGEDGYYSETHGDDGPYAIGLNICYFKHSDKEWEII